MIDLSPTQAVARITTLLDAPESRRACYPRWKKTTTAIAESVYD
jgi:hypothetical protein